MRFLIFFALLLGRWGTYLAPKKVKEGHRSTYAVSLNFLAPPTPFVIRLRFGGVYTVYETL